MVDSGAKKRLSRRDILIVIFKRRGFFFSFFTSTVLLVIVATYTLPLPCKTVGKIIIERTKSPSIPSMAAAGANYLEREEVVNSEIEILGSRAVAEMVVDRVKLHEIPPKESLIKNSIKYIKEKLIFLGLIDRVSPREGAISLVQKEIKVKSVPKSNVIKLQYISDDPNLSAQLVNELMEAYLDRRIELFKSKGARTFYKEQAQIFKERMNKLSREEQTLRAKWSIGELKSERDSENRGMEDIKLQIRTAEKELAEITDKIDSVRHNTGYVPFNDREGRYYIVDTLGASLLELELQQNKLEQDYMPDNPQLAVIRAQIKKVNSRLLEALNSIGQSLKVRLVLLRSQQNLSGKDKQNLNEREGKLQEIAGEITLAEKSYMYYFDLMEQARLSESSLARLVNVKILDYAVVPQKPIFPRIIFILIGIVFAGITAYGVVLIIEYFDHTLDSSEDVEYFTDIPVFGVLPDVKSSRITGT